MTAGITLDGITKRFDDVTAVDGVDLSVREGEFLVLVGPSGCGKSTTLRTVAGLETPTDGEIRIGETPVTDRPPHERDVAMVFQSYALYPHMTARKNMTFGVSARSDIASAEIDRRVEEAAETLDIPELLERKPGALSGGEKQRVAIGRALVRDPEVFLLDEPLSNLDAKLRVEMRAELARLHAEVDTTTVYVTHDQTEAMTLGDRVAVMNEGQIEQVASPQRLYDRPATQFVAEFIGSPAMNTLSVSVETDGVARTRDGTRVSLPDAEGRDALAGDDAVLGIRPEDFTHVSDGALSLDVTVTEPLGDTLLVRGQMGSQPVEVQLEPRTAVEAGDTLSLSADPDRLHLFDPETGEALYRSADHEPESNSEAGATEQVA